MILQKCSQTKQLLIASERGSNKHPSPAEIRGKLHAIALNLILWLLMLNKLKRAMREGAPRGSPLLICLIVAVSAWPGIQPSPVLLLQTPSQSAARATHVSSRNGGEQGFCRRKSPQDGESLGQQEEAGAAPGFQARLPEQEADPEQGASASCGFSPVLKP